MTTQLQQAQSLLLVHMCTRSYGPWQLHKGVNLQHPYLALCRRPPAARSVSRPASTQGLSCNCLMPLPARAWAAPVAC